MDELHADETATAQTPAHAHGQGVVNGGVGGGAAGGGASVAEALLSALLELLLGALTHGSEAPAAQRCVESSFTDACSVCAGCVSMVGVRP